MYSVYKSIYLPIKEGIVLKKFIVFASGIYDYYKSNAPHNQDYGLYQRLSGKSLYAEQGIYTIVMNAAVILSGIAFLVSLIALTIEARAGNQKLSDAKKWIIRVLIISVLIFAVTGIIVLIQNSSLDATVKR